MFKMKKKKNSDKIFPSAKMINDDGNEVVLFSEEKKYLLSLLKNVFASPTIREHLYILCLHASPLRHPP